MIFSFLVDQCSRCQSNAIESRDNIVQNMQKKRPLHLIDRDGFNEFDGVVPVDSNTDKLQQSLSEPVNHICTLKSIT